MSVNLSRDRMQIGVNVGQYQELPDLVRQGEMMSGFPVVRFMEWQQINRFRASPPSPKTMEDLPHGDNWQFNGGAWHLWGGVPISVIVDTANRAGVRPWLCVHHTFRDMGRFVDYVCKTATHRPIFEFSNEVWNSGFQQYHDLATMITNDKFRGVLELYAKRVAGLSTVVAEGGDVVVSAQSANAWVAETILSYMPSVTGITALAIAPYWKSEAELWAVQDRVKSHKEIANRYGLDLYCYEGGQHITTQGGEINRSQHMAIMYSAYLRMLEKLGVSLACLYSLASTYTSNRSWGLYEIVGKNYTKTLKRAIL